MNTLPSTWLNHAYEISLCYKRPLFDSMQYVKRSQDANDIIKQYIDHGQLDLRERFWVICLSNANAVLGIAEVGTGGTTAVHVSIRYVFQLALSVNAVAIIVVHNHPSGTLKVSSYDKAITKKLCSAGECLNINVLDHLIITSERYLSMSDELMM